MTMLAPLVPLRTLEGDRLTGPAFSPYASLVARFAALGRFPTASELNDALSAPLDLALGERTVRFEAQRGKRRGPLASIDDAYEARIDARGVVPTRTCLHDFAN